MVLLHIHQSVVEGASLNDLVESVRSVGEEDGFSCFR